MPLRCGIDIVHIRKIERLSPQSLSKFFSPGEVKGSAEHLAGVIAAKEAFFKALGIPPRFLEVEVIYEKSGRPKLKLSPELKAKCDVSISHDGEYAVAVVVME